MGESTAKSKAKLEEPRIKRASRAPSGFQHKVRFMTRAMAEEFTRQDVLKTTFREAVLYAVFILAVTLGTIGRRSSTRFYLTQALKGQFLDKEFLTIRDREITFREIRTITDFWFYAENLMVRSFYWEYYYGENDPLYTIASKERKILFENKLLGVPRIRQVKVRNDSCIIHQYFRRLFSTCYDLYSDHDKDTDTFGPGNSTAWIYSPEGKTKGVPYKGKVSTYEGGGFYHDLSTDRNGTYELLAELKANLWVQRGTRAIFVDFSIYNANLNLFAICKLIFELPPTGGVIPSHSFLVARLLPTSDPWYITTFVFEIIVYAMVGYFIIEEMREIIYFKWRYFLQFWTYIDLVIISLAVGKVVVSYAIIRPLVSPTIAHVKHHQDEYGNFEYLGAKTDVSNNLGASLLFFSYIKVFKYLNFNKTMGQLNNTLKRCVFDILGFALMFFIIFFAFAELGYLLFGSQVADFSSFSTAMLTLLRTILGDFNYQAIEEANRVLAPIYFLAYIFFVFFVLLNMFLAIINDTYADVKTEIAIAPDEMQMTEYLKNGMISLLEKCGCKMGKFKQEKAEVNTTIQQIRDALKKCGFSDLEIEMFFARYNIDPLAEVGDYDIRKIMKEFEGQALAKEKIDDDTTLVHVNDFIAQQERLEQIESTIQLLMAKLNALLQKLETLENVRKGNVPKG